MGLLVPGLIQPPTWIIWLATLCNTKVQAMQKDWEMIASYDKEFKIAYNIYEIQDFIY